MKLFLFPLVLARSAEIQGNDFGSGTLSYTGSKVPEPTASFQSRIHLKISLVASARGRVRQGARSLLRSAEVVKQETTAARISWVGGMVSISPTTYVLWLWVRRKKAQ